MMWQRVIPAWIAVLKADTALATALGGNHIYPAQAGRVARIPSVEYTLPLTDVEADALNRITIQVDYWARGVSAAATIEARLRTVTHSDTPRTMGTLKLWSRYVDSRTHEYPAEPGVTHRSLDFLFEVVRLKYQPVPTP
jgi:hypothetical protein